MTSEEIQAVQEIQGSGGFRVIQFIGQKKLEELRNIENIDENSNAPIQNQALGRKYAAKIVKEFLEEINLLPTEIKETRRTHE